MEHPQNVKAVPLTTGNRVYVLAHGFGLIIARLSPSGEITELGRHPLPGPPGAPLSVAEEGGFAYVASGNRGLYIIDVRDATDPRLVGLIELPGSVSAVYVENGYAYTTGSGTDLSIVDVRDPYAAVALATIEESDTWSRVDVLAHDGIAYVSTRGGGMLLYDVSQPDSPRFIIRRTSVGEVWAVALGDGYLYAGFVDRIRGGGVQIYDNRDPRAPRSLGYWRASSADVSGLYLNGDRVFVARWRAGVGILDASDPEHPREMATIPGGDRSAEVVGQADLIVVANRAAGVSVYDVASCIGTCGPADFDSDSRLTIYDFLVFSNLFEAADPRADLNSDSTFTIADFLEFQRLFVAGC